MMRRRVGPSFARAAGGGMLFLAAVWAPASAQTLEEQARTLADTLPVSQLEPGLSAQRLAPWFAEITGGVVEVEMDDCGESTGDGAYPICVSLYTKLPDERELGLSVLIGDSERGINGPPRLFMAWIRSGQELEFVETLGDLAERVRTRSAQGS